MRGRRRRLLLHKISNSNDSWIQGDELIAQEACEYYHNIFTGKNNKNNERILQHITSLISQEQNQRLQDMPNMEVLK